MKLCISPATTMLLAGAALMGTAAPAAAQVYAPPPPPYYPAPEYPRPDHPSQYPQRDYGSDEDIVVYGHYGRVPRDAESLSQRVSYRDLDLYYPEDRRELRRRVSASARYLCDRLGEDDSDSSILSSCRDAATRDALSRVGTVEAHWVPRGSYLVR